MGSHSIRTWREMHPSLSDYQLAEMLSSIDPRNGAVIVRYKHGSGQDYDQFASCADEEQLLSYFNSKYCHDAEIFYVHPKIERSLPYGLRITNDAPEGSYVRRLRNRQQAAEKRSTIMHGCKVMDHTQMDHSKVTLGAFFDIDKLTQKCGTNSYGFEGWKIIWSATNIQNLKGDTYLFDGDTYETLSHEERVWCAAFQSDNRDNLSYIRSSLENSPDFKDVASAHFPGENFPLAKYYAELSEEPSRVCTQPLPGSGCIVSKGRWKGKTVYDSYRALDSLGLVSKRKWWQFWR
jgi:hypothetical protein